MKNKNILEKAAIWWIDVAAKSDNKYDSGDPVIDNAMKSSISEPNPILPAQRLMFINNFIEIMNNRHPNLNVIIGIDYGLEGILEDCLQNTGVSHNIFPIKTDMYINSNGTIEVSLGYGAKDERLK